MGSSRLITKKEEAYCLEHAGSIKVSLLITHHLAAIRLISVKLCNRLERIALSKDKDASVREAVVKTGIPECLDLLVKDSSEKVLLAVAARFRCCDIEILMSSKYSSVKKAVNDYSNAMKFFLSDDIQSARAHAAQYRDTVNAINQKIALHKVLPEQFNDNSMSL